MAVLRQRIVAQIADAIFLVIPIFVIVYFTEAIFIWKGNYGAYQALAAFLQPSSFWFWIVGPIFPILYAGILIGKYQWTLGKRYTNIEVVSKGTFTKISFSKAFLRVGIQYYLPLLGGLLWIINPSAGYIFSFIISLINICLIKFHPKRQTIHDLIAGTQVIAIPLDKKKKRILNIIAIILFILLFAAFGNLVYQASKLPEEKLKELIEPFKETQKENLNWQTFENEKYGYEIDYPKDWYSYINPDKDVVVFRDTPQEVGMKVNENYLITIAVIKDKTLKELIKEWKRQGIESKKIMIGDKMGYKSIGKFPTVAFSNKGVVYVMVQASPSECKVSECKIFNNILSTFRFLE